jgi:hypothetical protein
MRGHGLFVLRRAGAAQQFTGRDAQPMLGHAIHGQHLLPVLQPPDIGAADDGVLQFGRQAAEEPALLQGLALLAGQAG